MDFPGASLKSDGFSKTLGTVANEVSVSYTGTSKAMVAAAWRRHGEIIAVKVEFFYSVNRRTSSNSGP